MAEMRETMSQLRLSAESSLGKILDKGQVSRLKQIQLQLEGPWVVLREDMIEKLNLTEEQVEMLTEIRDGQRQKQREMQKTNREAFDAVMKQVNPDFNGFGRGNRGNRGGGGAGGAGGGGAGGGGGAAGGGAAVEAVAVVAVVAVGRTAIARRSMTPRARRCGQTFRR